MEDPSKPCRHTHLLVIVEDDRRLRCRICHLTISTDELGDRHCPECWEERGVRSYDFEPVATGSRPAVRYRCETCGAMLQPRNG